jgi:two-component system capsular synthesis response regulator RcsB
MTILSSSQRIRVMLLDDHPVILTGIENMLSDQEDITIVSSFTTSDALMAALQQEAVDILRLDYALGPDDVDGLNLIRALRTHFPGLRLLIMSSFNKPEVVAQTMRYGADGFVGKEQPLDDLLLAIRTLAAQPCLHQNRMTELDINNLINAIPRPQKLSPCEQNILTCYLDGMSLTQIALKFDRSIKTISSQKTAACKKLGISNDQELFQFFYRLNSVKSGQ